MTTSSCDAGMWYVGYWGRKDSSGLYPILDCACACYSTYTPVRYVHNSSRTVTGVTNYLTIRLETCSNAPKERIGASCCKDGLKSIAREVTDPCGAPIAPDLLNDQVVKMPPKYLFPHRFVWLSTVVRETPFCPWQ